MVHRNRIWEAKTDGAEAEAGRRQTPCVILFAARALESFSHRYGIPNPRPLRPRPTIRAGPLDSQRCTANCPSREQTPATFRRYCRRHAVDDYCARCCGWSDRRPTSVLRALSTHRFRHRREFYPENPGLRPRWRDPHAEKDVTGGLALGIEAGASSSGWWPSARLRWRRKRPFSSRCRH